MELVHIARQPIVNVNGKTVAYELLYRDTPLGIKDFPSSNLKATSQVLINTLTHMNYEEFVGDDKKAFVNCDHDILFSGILDGLDPTRFIIEILETTKVSIELVNKIADMHKLGYRFALDDFDCSQETIAIFKPILKYMIYIKIDISAVDRVLSMKIIPKLLALKLNVIIERVETREEYKEYLSVGANYFQGYLFGKPEVFSVRTYGDITKVIILKLISMIQSDEETSEIEKLLKKNVDITISLLKYLNNKKHIVGNPISSIPQAIALLGRGNMLKWLLIYLYAEIEHKALSKELVDLALERASYMEKNSKSHLDKDKIFLVGMFSFLDVIFDDSFSNIFKNINIGREVSNAIIFKEGPIGSCLREAEQKERDVMVEYLYENQNKIKMQDIQKLYISTKVDGIK